MFWGRGRRRAARVPVKWYVRAGRWASTAVTVALVATVGAGAYGWSVKGMRYVPVLTDSMSPDMPVGSLAITKPLDPTDLKEGQVIAFRPAGPLAPQDGRPVLHRVWKLETQPDGQRTLQTKGDANASEDSWVLKVPPYGSPAYAQVVHSVPRAGAAAQALSAMGPWGVSASVGGLMLTMYGLRRLLSRRS
ncbi:signal peptidase I [Streptomyces sp. CBMA152]|uniref:signal peptidase I n=1 Tax=Streptomyces sp. CBMA152 TaxID=1896312 RepID=UPI002948BFCD|nr:signal peptidase I [Streptomyces sp. CBMA152]